MKRSKTLAGMVCALVLGGSMFVGVVPALADDNESNKAGSSIDMTFKTTSREKGRFEGRVSSGKDQCLGDRVVKLFKADGTFVDEIVTAHGGRFSFHGIKRGSGKYYSKVIGSKVTLDSGVDKYGDAWKHVLNCDDAQSGEVKVKKRNEDVGDATGDAGDATGDAGDGKKQRKKKGKKGKAKKEKA